MAQQAPVAEVNLKRTLQKVTNTFPRGSCTGIFPPCTTVPHNIFCHCKSVELEFTDVPSFCTFCHCPPCREAFRQPFIQALVFMHGDDTVKVVKGAENIRKYKAYDIGAGHFTLCFCDTCGELLMHENKFGFTLMHLERLRRGRDDTLPNDLHPIFHLEYNLRVQNVYDGLVKFKDFPKFLGGSGAEMTEDGTDKDPSEIGKALERYNFIGGKGPPGASTSEEQKAFVRGVPTNRGSNDSAMALGNKMNMLSTSDSAHVSDVASSFC